MATLEHMDEFTGPETDALVFTGERGTLIGRSWFYRWYWKPATRAAGMDGLRWHDLRHTFVALWVSLGRNVKEVSRAAGHSSVAFTLDRYGHLYEADSDGLADELDNFLGQARPHHQSLGPRPSQQNLAIIRPRGGHRPHDTNLKGRRPRPLDD